MAKLQTAGNNLLPKVAPEFCKRMLQYWSMEDLLNMNPFQVTRAMAWDGTLSPVEFKDGALKLVEAWEASVSDMPAWKWHSFQDSSLPAPDPVGGYLSLEDVPVASAHDDMEEEEGTCPQDCDDVSTAAASGPQYHLYTYHIVYKESYRVPSLLFKAQLPDGRQLDFVQVQRDLPDSSCEELKRQRWTFLTQEDHPYLHQPWFTLHPCGTAEQMRMIFSADPLQHPLQYLLTWLSLSGEAAGLKLFSDTFTNLWHFK